MLNVTIKLTGSNLDAIQDALNNAAQLIGDGERHGEIGGGNIFDGEFFVEGDVTFDDDTINEAFHDAFKASFGDSDSLPSELIGLAIAEEPQKSTLAFDKGTALFRVISIHNGESTSLEDLLFLDDVGVSIDDDEALVSALNAMYEELGFHGDFDKVTVDMMIETQRSDELAAKKNEHIIGLISDTLTQKDWASWSLCGPGRISIAREIAKSRGFS
jgi:uncharacterized protein YihD (DUF1040 family)